MMTIAEILTAIRIATVSALSDAHSANPDAHVEPAYRTADGKLAVDGVWKLPCRADLIAKRGAAAGVSHTVNGKSQLKFNCVDVGSAQVVIQLCPFQWDALTLNIAGLSWDKAKAVLVPWFWRWFDEADNNDLTSEGLYGVVHFMSDPEWVDGALQVRLDLGSVPESALNELLGRLADVGASQVRLG